MHPFGHSCREHEALQVLGVGHSDRLHNVFNVFLEAEVEHDVGLVEYRKFEVAKIKVSALHMVLDSASRSDENINAATQLSGLTVNVDTTINGKNVVLLGVVLQDLKFLADLESEFSSWSEDHSEGLAAAENFVPSEHFDHG